MSTPTPNTQNPYAPPTARVEDVADASGPGELAGRGTRLGAILLDGLILGVAENPFGVAMDFGPETHETKGETKVEVTVK